MPPHLGYVLPIASYEGALRFVTSNFQAGEWKDVRKKLSDELSLSGCLTLACPHLTSPRAPASAVKYRAPSGRLLAQLSDQRPLTTFSAK